MSAFFTSSLGQKASALTWLSEYRDAAEASWQQVAWPTRKTEDWKYTSLKKLDSTPFGLTKEQTNHGKSAEALVNKAKIEALMGSLLVFVNGQYSADLSHFQPEDGVELIRFAEARADQQALIQTKLNTCLDTEKHIFASLNAQCIDDGIFVQVSKNTIAKNPIHILNINVGEPLPKPVTSRLFVDVARSASVKVIEHFYSEEGVGPVLNNSITELSVDENAELTYYMLMEEHEAVRHISGVHAKLQKASRLHSFYLTFGTDLTRLDITAQYDGEGAEANINGVYLPQNQQHVDVHTCIEHAVPHCNSNEVFRGIISDSARAVFNGRIHIHPDAQKTEAYLSNKNLLTSNKAEVDTKPELEIYADDVRCAHGATIAQLEEQAMHYLRTRGVSEDEARVMLSFGFINELINGLNDEAISDYCRPKIAARFSRDESLTRHLG